MCLNVLHSHVLLECFLLFFKKEALMKMSSYGSPCVLHSLRKSQTNAAVINTEVCQESQFLGRLQISPARVACRKGYFEHFPVPATVCPSSVENASFGTMKAKANTCCMSASTCSPHSLFGMFFNLRPMAADANASGCEPWGWRFLM